jgi:carbamoylphosphate synthase large subunit
MSENSIAGIAKLTLSSRTTKRVRNRAGIIASAVNFIGPPIITRDEIASGGLRGMVSHPS